MQETFKSYLVANLERDYRRVCELMTPEQRALRISADAPRTSVEECEKEISLPGQATERHKRTVRVAEIAGVTVDGDEATAYVRLDGCTLAYTGTAFRRTAGGEWLHDGRLGSGIFGSRCVGDETR